MFYIFFLQSTFTMYITITERVKSHCRSQQWSKCVVGRRDGEWHYSYPCL